MTAEPSPRQKRGIFDKNDPSDDYTTSIEIRDDSNEELNAVGITATIIVSVKVLAALVSGILFATSS